MFTKTHKHVYFIEGGDNVGKTTTISNFKDTKFIESLKYNRIVFSKYPTANATETINDFNRKINNLEELRKSQGRQGITLSRYVEQKQIWYDDLIKYMINDMMPAFTREDLDPYHLKCPDDILSICDRGFLSTYLYQYRNYPGEPKFLFENTEREHLEKFVELFVPESDNDINVVILHNNANPMISSDIMIGEEETIEYKKQFDNDVDLQRRINSSLNNIVGLIEHKKLDNLLPIKFYYINIFDETGSIRKTPNEICKELVDIINKED